MVILWLGGCYETGKPASSALLSKSNRCVRAMYAATRNLLPVPRLGWDQLVTRWRDQGASVALTDLRVTVRTSAAWSVVPFVYARTLFVYDLRANCCHCWPLSDARGWAAAAALVLLLTGVARAEVPPLYLVQTSGWMMAEEAGGAAPSGTVQDGHAGHPGPDQRRIATSPMLDPVQPYD